MNGSTGVVRWTGELGRLDLRLLQLKKGFISRAFGENRDWVEGIMEDEDACMEKFSVGTKHHLSGGVSALVIEGSSVACQALHISSMVRNLYPTPTTVFQI